jgi:hypothetical protein
VESDADSLFWSVGAPQALPPPSRSRGREIYARWFPRLRWELALIQGLFVAGLLGAVRRRDASVLVLAACVLLKFALQTAASPLGRLMLPATALELLAIGLSLSVPATSRARLRDGLVAVGVAAGLLLVEPRLSELVVAKDEPPLRVERFPLEIPGGGIARCTVEEGEVASLEWRRVWLRPPNAATPARVHCQVEGDDASVIVRIETGGVVSELPLGDGRLTLPEASGVSLSRATEARESTPPP